MQESTRTDAEELKSVVRERVELVVNDCTTFMRVKKQSGNLLLQWQTGDGGQLMVIGLFAVLNLLAKFHLRLVKPTAFNTENDVHEVQELREVLLSAHDGRESPSQGEASNHLTKRQGDYLKRLLRVRCDEAKNETQAFGIFVEALADSGIRLGIPKGDNKASEEVWRTFRNPLVHMATTRDGEIDASSKVLDVTQPSLTHITFTARRAFRRNETGHWVCQPHVLSQYMGGLILDFINARIDQSSATVLNDTLAWVRRESGTA